MYSIVHSREIDAPAELVWEVITDFKAYGEWNEYIVACESTLEVGSPIVLKARLLPFAVSTFREIIYKHLPGKTIHYGLPIPLGAVNGVRSHTVTRLASGKTKYESVYEQTGWLSFFARLIVGKQLERGFATMTEGIERRALLLVKQRENESKSQS